MRYSGVILLGIISFSAWGTDVTQPRDSQNIPSINQNLPENPTIESNPIAALNTTILQHLDRVIPVLQRSLIFIEENKPHLKFPHYAQLGTPTQTASAYPSSFYSQLQHLQRVLQAQQEQNAFFPESVLTGILHAIGPSTSDPTISNLLINVQNLETYLQNETTYIQQIGYLLREPAPSGTTPALPSLVQQIQYIFAPIFAPWETQFSYTEEVDKNDNIFSLLSQLQTALKNRPFNPYPGEISTLYEKVSCAQQTLCFITQEHIPVYYRTLQGLLTGPGSIVHSLQDTIAHVKGERALPPEILPETLLDKLCNVLKEPLIEHILNGRTSWPEKNILPKSWQSLISDVSHPLGLLNIPSSTELTTARMFFEQVSESTISLKALLAPCYTLCRCLESADYQLTADSFRTWMQWIGNENSNTNQDGTGILALCLQHISQKKPAIDKIVSLIGIYPYGGTFENVLVELFKHNLSDIGSLLTSTQTGQILDLIDKIVARKDLSPHLREMIGTLDNTSNETTFCARIKILQEMFERILKPQTFQHCQFIAAERIRQEGLPLIHQIQKMLAENLTTPAETLWEIFGKAWWSHDGIYKPVNELCTLLAGSSIEKVLINDPSPAPTLKNIPYYMSKLHNNIQYLSKEHMTQLQQTLGPSHARQTSRISNLREALDHLNQLMLCIAPFSNFPTPSHFYDYIISTLETNLLDSFKQLHTAIKNHVLHPNTSDFALLTQILGTIHDNNPESTSICAQVNFLIYLCQMRFWNILNSHTDNNPFSDISPRSLHHDLTALHAYLNSQPNADMNSALNLIGSPCDSKFLPSLFGRLASLEDMIGHMYNDNYSIPFPQLLNSAADFYSILHKLLNEKWSVHALTEIGEPSADLSEPSLFGIMNHMLSTCLSLPLEHNIGRIEKKLGYLCDNVKSSLFLSNEEKKQWLEKFDEISRCAQQIIQRFAPFASLFYAYQTLPLWRITQNIIDQIKSLNTSQYWMNHDTIIQTLQQNFGSPTDPIDTSPPTIFSQLNDFSVRLYSMCTNVAQWITSPAALATLAELKEQKESLFPGDCQLFFITYILEDIHKVLQHIQKRIALEPEYDAIEIDQEYREATQNHLAKINDSIYQITSPLFEIVDILPHALGAAKEELSCSADISESLLNLRDQCFKTQHDIDALLTHLKYPPYDETPPVSSTPWSCAHLEQSIAHLTKDFEELSEHIKNAYKQALSDNLPLTLLPKNLKIKTANLGPMAYIANNFMHIIERVDAMRKFVRQQVNQSYPLSCASCNPAKIATSLECLSNAMKEFCQRFSLYIDDIPTHAELATNKECCNLLNQTDAGQWNAFYPTEYDQNGVPISEKPIHTKANALGKSITQIVEVIYDQRPITNHEIQKALSS